MMGNTKCGTIERINLQGIGGAEVHMPRWHKYTRASIDYTASGPSPPIGAGSGTTSTGAAAAAAAATAAS
jgi:hypothetical protein